MEGGTGQCGCLWLTEVCSWEWQGIKKNDQTASKIKGQGLGELSAYPNMLIDVPGTNKFCKKKKKERKLSVELGLWKRISALKVF